jgi:mono/diheme cytochrome c family protein
MIFNRSAGTGDPRMHSGPIRTRIFRRQITTRALLGAALLGIVGCTPDAYDPELRYSVRTDWVVGPGTWEIQPNAFNLPGRLPMDQLRETLNKPENEVSADQLALRPYVGKKIFDPQKIPADMRADYAKNLDAMFGTPANPKVSGFNADVLKLAADALSLDKEALTADTIIKTLNLREETLAAGSKLYRAQCLHCHGLEGNGRGPTGLWVNPPPRDYRQGTFKFTSSNLDQGVRKPRREDLLHVVNGGIEGTSMPSFTILKPEEREAIVSYVIHLSMRGEAEYLTMADQFKDEKLKYSMTLREDLKNPTVKDALEDNLALAAGRWVVAQKPDTAIIPTAYTLGKDEKSFLESAARGAKVFLGAGGCISCHQNYGRESNLVYDDWGTIVRGRNLFDGIYRGGRRPLDLYYRIHSGIKGAGMTAYKDLKSQITPEALGLTKEQFDSADILWDLVNYLRALGYPELRATLRKDYSLNIPD